MTDIPNTQPDSREEHRARRARQDGQHPRPVRDSTRTWKVPAFSEADERVPISTRPMCSTATPRSRSAPAFAHNRRVMVQGYHGTGKSTHIEQVAARLKLAVHPHQTSTRISVASTWSAATRSC